MAGLMNNYFYGKAGKGDYTVEQMPTNRKQLFFTTLRVRLSPMMGLNFLHLLFCLPLLIMVYIGFQTLMFYGGDSAHEIGSDEMKQAYTVYTETAAEYAKYRDIDKYITDANVRISELDSYIESLNAFKATEDGEENASGEGSIIVDNGVKKIRDKHDEFLYMSLADCEEEKAKKNKEIKDLNELKAKETFEEEKEEHRKKANMAQVEYELYQSSAMKSNAAMSLLFMIPLMGLAGVGSTGQMYVLRNWARDEHSFMWQDYKAAIKNNWKQGLIVGLLNGSSLYLCFVGFITYGQMSATSGLFFEIPKWLMVMLLIVWWMMNEVVFPMMVTYDMKVSHLLRNSFIMVLARLPLSFAILLGGILVPVLILLLIPLQFSVMILILFYGLIGFSLTGFVYASYANSCFDRFLNPRIEGAEVNKGLHVVDDDDDEEEVKPLPEVEQKEDRFWERKS